MEEEDEDVRLPPVPKSEEEDNAAYIPPATTPRSMKEIQDELATIQLTERQKKIIGKHTLTPRHLETGFGIHTHRSLELALRASQEPPHVCKCIQCHRQSYSDLSTAMSHGSLTSLAQNQLKFLMGLGAVDEEGADLGPGELEEVPSDGLINGGTEAMRHAQRYLREHKIFEFFQFLIAHLLSENAYDPINFLINLLDKCLVYRSGMSEPPLLYSKKHIECLFNLMDRMRTGFIDVKQYETGMLSLGIKSFNAHPPLTADGMVPKQFFIEEAYESLKDLLNDMLRKRPKRKQKFRKVPKAPPPTTACSMDDFKNKD